jgi:glycosyltransferase involved in cell wall biosynthesis
MRVLFVCSFPCAVNTGSHQRLTHLLKGVAAVGEVTLVYPAKEGSFGPDVDALRPFCSQVYTFPFESLAYQRDSRLPRPIYWAKHKLRYLHPMAPALIQQLWSKEGHALVADLCARPFDLIWSQRISSLPMLPARAASRVVVDLDDIEHRSLRSRLLLRKDPAHMVPLQWLEYVKLRKLESSLSGLPYEFIVCSKRDQEVLGAKAKVWVIPNGVDLPTKPSCLRAESPAPTLVFVGYMAYEPNADAAVFFVQQVLPRIQRDLPDVRFIIVGADPTPSVCQLHNGKSVFVTGAVPEVADYLCAASVVVVPIRFGGGTRIKILEALAHRKAVVSTTKGAEGIDVQPGKHLLLADSPEDLGNACKRLLRDAALRKRLGDGGFRLIQDRYQWKAIEDVVGNIASGRASISDAERTADVQPEACPEPRAQSGAQFS